MKKKLLVLLLALVLALCAFVSCGDEEEPGESTSSSSTSSSGTDGSKPTTESKPPVIEGGDEDCVHDWKSVSKTEATCKAEGEESFKCSKCDATKKQTLAISTIHSYEVIETKEPTCQEAGVITKKCKVCEKVETQPNGEMLRHQPGEVIVVEPTCDKNGEKKSVCSMCGMDYVAVGFDPVIPKLGHSYEKAENILAAEGVTLVEGACEVEGYFEVVCVDCGAAGKNITRADYADLEGVNDLFDVSIYDKMKKLEHNYTKLLKQVDPTCDVDGYTEYQCTRCDSIRKTNPIKAAGHTYKKDATAVEGEHFVIVTKATCLADGKKAFICTVCKTTGTDEKGTETIKKLDHDTTKHTEEFLIESKEATCTVYAYKKYKCCVTASCTESVTIYDEAAGYRKHNFVKIGEPSCLTEGKTPAKCSYEDCGMEAMHPDIPAVLIKHTLGEILSEATCVSNAKYKCELCTTEYGPYENDEAYENGFAHGRHIFGEGQVVEPTCSSIGYKKFFCVGDPLCDFERKNPNLDQPDEPRAEDIIARIAHNFDTDGNGEIDITPDGRIVCAVCSQQYRDITTQISKGNGKLCLGCDSESIESCTCGLEVKWNGYVSPSIPDEHNVAKGGTITVSSVNWDKISAENGGGTQALALGYGIVGIYGEEEIGTYTIAIYDSADATEAIDIIEVSGKEEFVDLYNYASVGKISITSTIGATVFFYEVPSDF